MISPEELERTLTRIRDLLDGFGIRYHCTGGLVSSFYGEPRFTQDIDIVVRLVGGTDQTSRLMEALNEHYVIDPSQMERAIARHGMFQALDKDTWIKIDFHVGEAIPGELERSIPGEILPGIPMILVSREDAVLSKLLWITKGSHKSRQDVVMMLRAMAKTLNWDALTDRAVDLQVSDLLTELQKEAGLL